MNPDIGRIDRSLTMNLGCATLIVIVIGAVLYPVFATARTTGHPRTCVSNLKQLGTACFMYAADSDDLMPPYYTFDFPANWEKLNGEEKGSLHPAKKFKTVIDPYTKNNQLFICTGEYEKSLGADGGSDHEGLPGVMSFVHCLSLKGAISGYGSGKRVLVLDEKETPDPASIAFLRDPIRGFGKNSDGQSTFFSPHKSRFIVSYLDGHVKGTEYLDPRSQL